MHNTLVIMWPPCQEEWRHEVSLLDCLAGCCSMTPGLTSRAVAEDTTHMSMLCHYQMAVWSCHLRGP